MQETNHEDAFKIYFKDSIRRVTLNSKRFENVVTQLNKLYNADGLYHPELKIQYVDEEGDKVTVSSQVEWEEMFAGVGDARPIKLYVSEGAMAGKYFKDGPAPVAKELYVKDQNQQKTVVEDVGELSVAAPRSLSRIFPGGKILPYNLPEWLKPAVTVKATGRKEDVDLDVDIFKLIEVLHQQGYTVLEKGKAEDSKKYFLSIIDVSPNHRTAYYNLACAEALCGNADEAVKYLGKSVEAGYNNVAHIVKDSDLDSIRTHAGYVAIVNQFTAAEEQRKAEEAARIEAARIAAEQQRKAEEARIEAARIAAEEQRKAEEARIEAARIAAEEQRKAEEARIEAARIAAEEQRKAEEAARIAAEEQRKAEEAARIAAEEQRKAEEAARIAAEEQRKAEEAAKKAEEEDKKRKAAEEAEKKRKSDEEAERKRKAAEQAALKNYRYASQLKNLLGMGFDVNVAKMLLDNFNGDFDKSLEALLKMQ